MHELSIARAIVDTALRHAEGARVVGVDVRVGALRQVVPRSLDFYFEIAARETACEGARLRLEVEPAWLRCRDCGREWDPAPRPVDGHGAIGPPLPTFRCPGCASASAELVRGEALEVESIEITQEEQCIAPR